MPETTDTPENVQTTDTPAAEDVATDDTPEPETFPAAYVRELRQENARYRTRAQDADALAQRLHASLVAATGRLVDPSDLPFDGVHLTDEAALTAAVDALLERKPRLASRTPRGDVGQGVTGTGETVDLAGILRGLAS